MAVKKRVVIVGGGFAGTACAHKLLKNTDLHVTLIDKNNFHEFTPLIYQMATSALSPDVVATNLRYYFAGQSNIDIKMTQVNHLDPEALRVGTEEGQNYQGDYLVLAAGSVVNFFNTPGAHENSCPLYTFDDAGRIRSRIVSAFEGADRNPDLIENGILNFVIIGAGPTGVEMSGALADMLKDALPRQFLGLAIQRSCIYLVDGGPSALSAFSNESQTYATKILKQRGVHLRLDTLVQEVTPTHVKLSNGEIIPSQTVIWAGGLKAAPFARQCGLSIGHGGRVTVQSDLTVAGHPKLYAIGDFANTPGPDGKALPQLAAVAQQSGSWAADNILADINGQPRKPFAYRDKGIMAMIGKNAAVAEVGKKRRKLSGALAFFAWLSVHASMLPTLRQRIRALYDWSLGYLGNWGSLQIVSRENAERIRPSTLEDHLSKDEVKETVPHG